MTWLGTNSGKRIDLLNPQVDQIDINDIARALSYIPRFMGQTNIHYSVLTHSVNVASLVPNEYKLCALLHDATEAYVGDVPTPLKDLLGDAYRDVEKRLARVIGKAFNCHQRLDDLPQVIKDADKLMLVTEHHIIQDVPAAWGWDDNHMRLELLPNNIVSVDQFKQLIREAQGYAGVPVTV